MNELHVVFLYHFFEKINTYEKQEVKFYSVHYYRLYSLIKLFIRNSFLSHYEAVPSTLFLQPLSYFKNVSFSRKNFKMCWKKEENPANCSWCFWYQLRILEENFEWVLRLDYIFYGRLRTRLFMKNINKFAVMRQWTRFSVCGFTTLLG